MRLIGLSPAIKTVSLVRQIVLTGPVDANGQADFLQAGTGRQATTKALSPALSLGFGSGFSDASPVDNLVVTTSALTWSSLPASSTSYLYVNLNLASAVLTAAHGTLAPIYAQAKPSGPATGQYWYPTDHRCSGEVWSGSAWTPELRIYLGQVITNATVPTEIRSYAYGGRWEGTQALAANTNYNLSHNLGTDKFLIDGTLDNITGAGSGYIAGSSGFPFTTGLNAFGAPNDGMYWGAYLRKQVTTLLITTGQFGVGLMLTNAGAQQVNTGTANLILRRAF